MQFGYIAMRAATIIGLALYAVLIAVSSASGQGYPSKPIRLITAEAGGGNDFAARLIVQGLAGSLGQQMVVDNRGGAGGIIAVGIGGRAQAGGFTLLVSANNIWPLPMLRRYGPYVPGPE